MVKAWFIGGATFLATVAAGLWLTQGANTSVGPAGQKAIPASSAAAPTGERIEISTVGLSLVRPSDWTTITAEQNAQNLRSVEMEDRALQELAARYANAPIIAFSKYKEPYDDLNPSFKINVRSIGSFAGRSPEHILEAAIPTLRRMFGDLKVENAPTRTTLSGKAAAYTRLSYTLRAGGGAFPTVSEIWVVPSGPVFFMIGTGTRADERNGSRAETRRIVDSIRIR